MTLTERHLLQAYELAQQDRFEVLYGAFPRHHRPGHGEPAGDLWRSSGEPRHRTSPDTLEQPGSDERCDGIGRFARRKAPFLSRKFSGPASRR